jgi:hypothetical protein
MARITATQEILNEIKVKVEKDGEFKFKFKREAEKVHDHWVTREAPSPENLRYETIKGHADDWPYTTGAYRDSIKIRQSRSKLGRFLSAYEVYTDSPIAHFIEYGTKIDNPDSRSPWGRFTPTYPYAPAARTAFHFGGTTD